MRNVLRYVEQFFVEFNGTHFRLPGGKVEVRCEAESDCVGEIILSVSLSCRSRDRYMDCVED